MTTLKVKNDSGDTVQVVLEDETTTIDIADGAEADLDLFFLQSESFREHFIDGNLSFIKTPLSSLSEEQQELGESILVLLLSKLSGRVLSQHGAMVNAKTSLARTRLVYNDRHEGTKSLLEAGKALGPGAENLIDAAKHFINTTTEQAAVTDIEALITAKEAEDLDALGKTLADWYAEREELQNQLEAAQAALDAATAEYTRRFDDLFAGLEEASDDMNAVDPSTDIGSEIPPFP